MKETHDQGHQLAWRLSFLAIAVKRVINEMFVHVAVIVQRSKSHNHRSAGTLILP
jgi:hypothetical protein